MNKDNQSPTPTIEEQLDAIFIGSMQPKFGETPPASMLGWEEVHYPTLKEALTLLVTKAEQTLIDKIANPDFVYELMNAPTNGAGVDMVKAALKPTTPKPDQEGNEDE